MKKCCKCGEEKPKTLEFFRLKNKDRGVFRAYCKRCESDMSAIRWKNRSDESVEKTKERDRLRAAKKRAENPEYFKAYEQKRRSSANYKAWCVKQQEANKEKSFLRNIGSFCAIRFFKCRVCSDNSIRKAREKSTLCKECTEKRLYVKGMNFIDKTACCKACGEEHLAKNKNAYCHTCKDVRKRISKIKERRRIAYKEARRRRNAKDRYVKGSFKKRCIKYGVLYTQLNRPDVFNRDNWTCVYCGVKVVQSRQYKPNQATIDHVIPLSKGGTHTIDNVVTSCQSCNSTKSDTVSLKQKKTNQLVIWLR